MKNFFKLILAFALLLPFISCNKEPVEQPGAEGAGKVTFASVPLNIGEADAPGTRSQISLQSESFVCAYLFCFDNKTKQICCYPNVWEDYQGDSGMPVAKYTTSKSFNWALPMNTAIDLWAVVNPQQEHAEFLAGKLADKTLTEDDLYGDALMFTCPSSSVLKALDVLTDGTGIPMAGRLDDVTIQSASDGVTIAVKRLFAKYEIKFDIQGYEDEGYTVNAFSVRGSKSNTEVPFFWNGNYTQTDRDKLNVLDYGTTSDLDGLNSGDYVTLYFLENCQGTKSGVEDWYTIYDDLNETDPTLDLCSYIEVAVNVTKPVSEGKKAVDRSFIHRVYVGETFIDRTAHTYNFDVKRNLSQKIKLMLKPYNPDEGIDMVPSEVFLFTSGSEIHGRVGECVVIPYVWKGFDAKQLEFESTNNLQYYYNNPDGDPVTIGNETYSHSGFVVYTILNEGEGKKGNVTGGKKEDGVFKVSDVEHVRTAPNFEDIEVTCFVKSLAGIYEYNYVGRGEDLNIGIVPNDGNQCYVALSGRVKYDGEWHDIGPSDDPLIQYSFTEAGLDATSTTWVPYSVFDNGQYSWNSWYMPGDVDNIYYWFNGEIVASFKIFYGSSGNSPTPGVCQGIEVDCEATVMGNAYSMGNTFSSKGEDMSVFVDDGGNYITYIVSGRIKYDNEWHDLTTDENVHLYVGSVTKPWSFMTGAKVNAGNTTVFQVYYGTSLVKSWTVTAIHEPGQILYSIDCGAQSNGTNYSGNGSDMVVNVTPNDGNEVTVSISGQIFYNGSWHNIFTDSNLKCYLDGYAINGWSWTNDYMPGDEEVVSIRLNGIEIKSWTISYE